MISKTKTATLLSFLFTASLWGADESRPYLEHPRTAGTAYFFEKDCSKARESKKRREDTRKTTVPSQKEKEKEKDPDIATALFELFFGYNPPLQRSLKTPKPSTVYFKNSAYDPSSAPKDNPNFDRRRQ